MIMKEENKSSKIESQAIKGKIEKVGKSKKSIVSALGIVGVIAIVTVVSFTQAQFSAAKIKTWQFWVNLAIMVALSIYSMAMGEKMGDDWIKNNENSNFRIQLAKYNAVLKSLEVGTYFSYFADWLEDVRLRKKKKEEQIFLKDCGIYQMEVLNLDRNELQLLINPYKKEWGNGKTTIFKSLTKEQIEAIEFVMDGGIKVSSIKDEWFKTGVEYKTKDMWESAAKAGLKKTLFINESRIYRIATICALSCLLNTLIPGSNGGSSAQAWIDYSSRIGTIMMSVVFGILVGWQAINIDRDYLVFKTEKLQQYKNEYDCGFYKHESFDEQVKREYEEYEKKQEEARQAVVTPENVSNMIDNHPQMIGGPEDGNDGRREDEEKPTPDILG